MYPSFVKNILLKYINIKYINIILPFKVYILALFYFSILLLTSCFILKITKKYGSSYNIKENTVKEIQNATDSFLPSYLGYFFVTLSISKLELFIIIFILIFIFTYKSRLAHFNPMFLILGYRYYFYKINGVHNLLITKRKIKRPEELEIQEIFRINDFTYIEI